MPKKLSPLLLAALLACGGLAACQKAPSGAQTGETTADAVDQTTTAAPNGQTQVITCFEDFMEVLFLNPYQSIPKGVAAKRILMH